MFLFFSSMNQSSLDFDVFLSSCIITLHVLMFACLFFIGQYSVNMNILCRIWGSHSGTWMLPYLDHSLAIGYGRRDPSRWPCGTIYPQKLALNSPTNDGRPVGVVRSRTKATVLVSLAICWTLVSCSAGFLPWKWRWYVPPKLRFLYGLNGGISQKMATFMNILVPKLGALKHKISVYSDIFV
jgi:hypothetical protein